MDESYKKLDNKEINTELSKLNSWELDNDRIRKTFEFKDFGDAFAFMTRMAIEIERINHHPEWFNVYNKVKVELTTHDVDGLSMYDFKLAKIMDNFEKVVLE